MTKRQKGKLLGGRVRRKKNEETAREMPGECGSRKTKKRGESRNSGYKNRKCVGGVKTYRKKAEEIKYKN